MILLAANNEFLGTERMGRLLFRLSAPTICAQLINMLYNVVDRMYIGHIPETGALALTGLGVCMPVIMVVSAFAAFVSMGGAPRASIAMGRGDSEGAKDILGTCFVLQLILSVILTAVLLLWNRPMLLAFGASAETIGYASDYMAVYAVGTLFVQLTLGMNAFITAQGFSGFGMLTVAIGAVLNIALDPLFIYTFDMGVKGAALATVLSQAVSAVWATYFLTSRRSVLKLERGRMRLRPSILLGCLSLGVAPFIMQASESVINVCYNTSLARYGGDTAVGAMTILSSVMHVRHAAAFRDWDRVRSRSSATTTARRSSAACASATSTCCFPAPSSAPSLWGACACCSRTCSHACSPPTLRSPATRSTFCGCIWPCRSCSACRLPAR